MCECDNWADLRVNIRFLTGHHENCPKAGDPLLAAMDLIRKLVHGIEYWAHEEDGVYPEVWEAYKQGKAVIGEFDWKETETETETSTKTKS